MKDIDYEKRPWVPYSGWPLSGNELQPYYERVHKLIGHHSPFQYDEDVWDAFDIVPPALNF